MSNSLKIRKAFPEEAGLLSQLALRSKAHWGYSNDFLEACRLELTVDASRIESNDCQCFVAVDGDLIIGFYTLEGVSANLCELDALFVEPERIGSGVGGLLVKHAIQSLSERGVERLLIQGDPHATEFYIAVGARQVGTRESNSIPGRNLPLYEIDVTRS
jgi:predicted N-acetyltransferase YhbS